MATPISQQRKNLLSSQCLVQAPFVRIDIGSHSFGVYKQSDVVGKDEAGFFSAAKIQYPNFVQKLDVVKINGQVNEYTLTLAYPVRLEDDPNFFDKVLSSVSGTRKIVFSYGDANQPNYIYKNEEAIITDVQTTFNFGNGGTISTVIGYVIKAVSACALTNGQSITVGKRKAKPSTVIKEIFNRCKLSSVFSGMTGNLEKYIAGDDAEVQLEAKENISPMDYISYLVGCMIPAGTKRDNNISKDTYIMTIHDGTTAEQLYNTSEELLNSGPYFKITRASYATKQTDAYEVNIGYGNSGTIVTGFTIDNNESYAMFYNYAGNQTNEQYVRRLVNGKWVDEYAPGISSRNGLHRTTQEDVNWWTQVTQYPISGTLSLQGLLRPATLMQYLRLNVIFPGGKKHNTSGLYIVTKQQDSISENGYRTTLGITRISGDEVPIETEINDLFKSNIINK